jgi:cytochrome c oxidase cbb3-type subunit IV
MSYDALRHFADSWGLVAMTILYLVLIGWHFRPGGKQRSQEATTMIFDEPQESGEANHG